LKMIKEEQLVFFTGIPGSAWSRVASVLGYSPLLNLNDTDRNTKTREFYLRRQISSWMDLVNHQGAFFGSGMEFGQGWEYPVERELTKEAVMKDIEKAFVVHNDQDYLVKSHSIAQCLDWWIENFPKAKFIFVFREYEAAISWWLGGGGFDIEYPKYDWYEDEERMRNKAWRQYCNTKEFIDENSVVTYGLTRGFLEEVLQIDMEQEADDGQQCPNNFYRALNSLPRDKDEGTARFDIQVGFYGFKDIL
jgi:hypothetical protein